MKIKKSIRIINKNRKKRDSFKSKKFLCPKCKNNIDNRFILNSKNVSKGYFCACKYCDEDFYSFELILIK